MSTSSLAPPVAPEAVADLLRTRRTIHTFRPDVPDRALLLEALELACWAPNHKMTEPWRFYLLGPETVAAITDLNADIVTEKRGERAGRLKRERWGQMPGWLLVTCTRDDNPLRDQEDYAATACAIQNLMLYLWSQGIGMKWGTGAVTRDLRFFDITGVDPAIERIVGLFWYGYPEKVPRACPRQPLATVLHELP